MSLRTRLLHIWETLSSSYWFVPSLMAAASIVVAFAMLALDRRVLGGDAELGWFYAGGAEGARSLLSTVASSTITVAGVVFSITIAALTQAANQFGPRLLRNFMRDTGNQVVLGTFLGTFVYCILILRSIDDGNGGRVPAASITGAVLLALASLAVLIYFIHHISYSMQAPQVVAAVGEELGRSIEHQFPGGMGRERPPRDEKELDSTRVEEDFAIAASVASQHDGYVQAIDQESLMRVATREDVRILLNCRPGHHLLRG